MSNVRVIPSQCQALSTKVPGEVLTTPIQVRCNNVPTGYYDPVDNVTGKEFQVLVCSKHRYAN